MPNSINPVPIFRALVYPKDRRIDFAYWQNRALASVKDHGAGSDIADYDYIGSRVLKRTMQNGVNLDFENGSGTYYDSLGRPTTWKHVKSGTTKIGFDLTYDRAGNPTAISLLHDTAKGSFSSIGYDSANRLLSSAHAGAWSGQPLAEHWTLDGVGNMKYVDGYTTGSRLTTSFNEYYSVAGVTNTQDDNGNLTSDGTLTYKWDGFNRLSEVKNGGTTVADYYYDGGGRRVAKVVSGTTTCYSLDGWSEIAEYTGTGASYPDREFIFGSYIDEPLVLDSNDSFDSSCTGSGDNRYYYSQNWQYSVCALTSGSGIIVEGYEYEPYGRHRVFYHSGSAVAFTSGDTTNDLGTSHYGNPFLYTGRRFDAETGLQYSRHRYYSQAIMRFLNQDPIGYADDINRYAYLRSSPITGVDSFGLWLTFPIFGDPQDRMSVQAEPGDTISGLARKIGLNESEYTKWFSSNQANISGPTDKLEGCPSGSVPNTAYVDVGKVGFLGDLKNTGLYFYLQNRANEIESLYKARNYKVIRSNDANTQTIWDHLHAGNMIAYAFIGHGGVDTDPGGIVSWDDALGGFKKIPPDKYTQYGLFNMTLLTCWSTNGIDTWVKNVSHNGWLVTVTGYLGPSTPWYTVSVRGL